MARPIAKTLMGFFLVAVLVVIGLVAVTLSQPALPARPLPNPNGYDDFVKAGKMIASNVWDAPGMSESELRSLVSANTPALRAAQAGFEHECRVPRVYPLTNSAHFENLPALKRLAHTLVAQGRLDEPENKPGEAADSYLEAIRLGHEASRGGVIIDSLVGIAIRAIGTAPLERLVPKLDAGQCQRAASVLEAIDARRETEAATLEQERAWVRRAYGYKAPLVRLVSFKSIRNSEQKWASRLRSQEARERLVLVQLAARAYELEKGERAKSLADLVPAYLKAIPQDPVTGTNMTYRP